MTGLQEVPTDELLSFHDFTPVHNTNVFANIDSTTTISINDLPKENAKNLENIQRNDDVKDDDEDAPNAETKLFWTFEYYQTFFNVDTVEVLERIVASIIPKRNDLLRSKIKLKPDLYGPFWISITLIFTIAISGNIANYLQHANVEYHWKYDFHLVSYAATTIILYISIVPILLWSLLKWSTNRAELDDFDGSMTSPLELVCLYGYSLFIYIPVSILWAIQIRWFQWVLVVLAALLSGSVLVFTLFPTLKLSKHKFMLMLGVACCHLLLATGFMLYFFHIPNSTVVLTPLKIIVPTNATTLNNSTKH